MIISLFLLISNPKEQPKPLKNNIPPPKVTAGIFQNCTFRVSGNAKPHRGMMFFIQKIETPPESGVFIVNYSTSWILADNFSQVLFVFPENFGCFSCFEMLGRKNSSCCFWVKRARFNEEKDFQTLRGTNPEKNQ